LEKRKARHEQYQSLSYQPPAAKGKHELAKHLREGTRPAAENGEPWADAEFAGEVQSTREGKQFASPRSVSNWRKGKSLPAEIGPILRALFGPPNTNRHGTARGELRKAFQAARAEKNAAALRRAKRDPAGGTWVVQDEQFVLDRALRATDKRAAADPIRQQLQSAARFMAEDLASRARRLSNSRTWGGITTAAEAFQTVTCLGPSQVLERLGEAYALLLRLGRFLETDARVRSDPMLMDDPLSPDIHGCLTDLVRTAAPWLRGFPTVAAMDDAAGKALVRADLFEPVREFTRIAREHETISARDADEIESLAKTADAQDFEGQKAGTRAVGSAKNLLLAAAELVAAFLAATPDSVSRSLLVQRVLASLTAAQTQIEAITAALPDDLRYALRALVEEGQRLDEASSPTVAIPPDLEAQARALILEGHPPPAEWRPLIHNLSFAGTRLESLDPLAGLTALRRLYLDGTQVSDVSPLAGLTALQVLDLDGTQVSDVSPLAGLTALHDLYLRGTQVSDVSPLAELTALRGLYLDGTQVSDVLPLTRLNALEELNLEGTRVRNVSAFAGLPILIRFGKRKRT
jgi:hypothetical protein